MNKRVEGTEAVRQLDFQGQRTEMEKEKMKSEKVRIFFPDGLKRLGGA